MESVHQESLEPHSWGNEYARLTAADGRSALEPTDLERLAMAAYLTGRDSESAGILARAHNAFIGQGNATSAARCAYWIAFMLHTKGDRAHSGGWFARARRLLDEGGQDDCVERGYLLLPVALQHAAEGDIPAAQAAFVEAARIGGRFGDRDLLSLARQGQGRALMGLGEIAGGLALLDEVMVGVTAGELSPIVAGVVYCSVISACFDVFDMRRAQEWTEALDRWCTSQDLVPYRGQCLVHRAEIMRLHGVWPEAIVEAQRACERLAESSTASPGVGAAAFYQLAELHRLRGEFAKAEEAYRRAAEAGRAPYPGLALLRLAQGRTDAAKAAICRVVDEGRDHRARPMLLSACVEILLATGDVPAARRAADQLSAIAAAGDGPFLRGVAAHASGAVLLAEGDARAAVVRLRDALATWREFEAPYEAARAGVLIGLAVRELGDAEGGRMELDAAKRTFEQLGAAPDLARLDELRRNAAPRVADSPLTARELEVLRLVASGRTNRMIADELAISEKTVARHVSNIFTKLDLSSRAAATAYAFQHHLVDPSSPA
jgi:DNA-binding CsgD family transcriptional regulator